jgi:predicted small lipoprotein YifL
MRVLIGSFTTVFAIMTVGCGQTGALHLPNDPNYDKRSQYLIYKDKDRETVQKQTQKSEQSNDSKD